jgi:hypothetical protein
MSYRHDLLKIDSAILAGVPRDYTMGQFHPIA